MSRGSTIAFSLINNDIRSVETDVIAMKYAQSFFGADAAIAMALESAGVPTDQLRLKVGEHIMIESQRAVSASKVLFVGVPQLYEFRYQQIREFSARVLEILAAVAPQTRRLAMTLHGPNYGLDAIECASRQLDGYRDALTQGTYPSSLRSIAIIERDSSRMELLSAYFQVQFSNAPTPPDFIKQKNVWPIVFSFNEERPVLKATQITSADIPQESSGAEKATIFVAMPFAKEMRDIWTFGIYQTVRNAGFLCERMDEEVFIGDVVERMKKRIEAADFVIADLTGGESKRVSRSRVRMGPRSADGSSIQTGERQEKRKGPAFRRSGTTVHIV